MKDKNTSDLTLISGIYQIINTTNNKIYVGSSINLKQRFNDHKKLLRHNKHPNNHLQSSWIKYGEDKFNFEIIEFVINDNLLITEQFYIDLFSSYDNKIGYNISKIAGNTFGTKITDESKLKMSIARTKKTKVNLLTDKAKNITDLYLKPSINMGKNNKKSKPVLQFDIENNLIKEWDSAGMAAKVLILSVGNIWMCCNGKYKTSYGFIWKYKN